MIRLKFQEGHLGGGSGQLLADPSPALQRNVPVLHAEDQDGLALDLAFRCAFERVVASGGQGGVVNIRREVAHRSEDARVEGVLSPVGGQRRSRKAGATLTLKAR